MTEEQRLKYIESCMNPPIMKIYWEEPETTDSPLVDKRVRESIKWMPAIRKVIYVAGLTYLVIKLMMI